MSDEMGRKTKNWKRTPGLGERVRRPESKHIDWVAAIANRFGVRNAGRGFTKAKLTDLTINERIQPGHGTATIASHYDQRQWIRNEFKTNERIRPGHGTATIASHYDQRQWIQNEFKTLVMQQLFVSLAIVSKNAGKPMPPALSKKLERLFAGPGETRHALAVPFFVRRFSRSASMAGNTEQQRVGWPLTFAGTKVNRRLDAHSVGSADVDESIRLEMPVARLAQRHQRVEVARERIVREFGPEPSMQSPESLAREVHRSVSRAKSHALQEGDVQEPSRMRAASHGGINVTQVADEVMKQLDRRLIAARERMGRI
jgi:hypothetical protein